MDSLGSTVHTRSGNAYSRHPTCLPAHVREIRKPFAPDHYNAERTLGGIRINLASYIPAGAIVEVSIEVCGRTERFRGTVHCIRSAGRRFEMAIRLTDPEQAFHARMVEQACQIEAYRRRASRREGRTLGIEQAASRWIAAHARRFARAWERPARLLAR